MNSGHQFCQFSSQINTSSGFKKFINFAKIYLQSHFGVFICRRNISFSWHDISVESTMLPIPLLCTRRVQSFFQFFRVVFRYCCVGKHRDIFDGIFRRHQDTLCPDIVAEMISNKKRIEFNFEAKFATKPKSKLLNLRTSTEPK